MDPILCPDLTVELNDRDWEHNLHEDFRITWFRNLNYLMNRQPLDVNNHQILALLANPLRRESLPHGFTCCGFDIVDECSGNSTLTNCGPMPDIFHPADVNHYGLLDDLDAANSICVKMRTLMPEDPHLNNCGVWQVGRRLPSG